LGGLDGISFKHKKNQIKEKKAHMTKKMQAYRFNDDLDE